MIKKYLKKDMHLTITKNYYNNQNQVLKEQLIGTNINQKYQYKHQAHI